MLYKMLFILGVLCLTLQNSCFYDRGPRFDIFQVSVGSHSVYFKREIGARNYKGLSISSDESLCIGPSQRTDYFVDSETVGEVFYKVVGDELQIYSQSIFTPPQSGNFPVKIVQKQVEPARYDPKSIKKQGYTELIFTNESLKYCS